MDGRTAWLGLPYSATGHTQFVKDTLFTRGLDFKSIFFVFFFFVFIFIEHLQEGLRPTLATDAKFSNLYGWLRGLWILQRESVELCWKKKIVIKSFLSLFFLTKEGAKDVTQKNNGNS